MGAWKFGASGTAIILGAGLSIGTPASTEVVHSGTIAITKTEPDCMAAPVGVILEATSLSGFTTRSAPAGTGWDPEIHDVEYFWTINGQPLSAFNAPSNMVTGWNNANIMKGKTVCFHFPLGSHGTTYTIDLFAVAIDGSATAIASTTTTPLDPDTEYAGTDTVVFADDGVFTGKPTGATEISSWSNLAAEITGATSKLRLLFKRGEDIPSADITKLNQNSSGEWLNYIGDWGSGNKPILRGGKDSSNEIFGWAGSSHPNTHVTICNIDFRGGWDAEHEQGVPSRTPIQMVNNDVAMTFLISECDFDGFGSVWCGLGDSSSTMILADIACTNWQDYGMYEHGGATDRIFRVGCRIAQHVDAGSGPPTSVGKETLYNQHGPIRDDGNIGASYNAVLDLFSRNGWSTLSPDTSEQPCHRANQNQLDGQTTTWDRCVMEGGGNQIGISPINSGTNMNPGNFVVDTGLFIASAKTWRGNIWCSSGGLTVRNAFCFVPNVAQYHTGNSMTKAIDMSERTGGSGTSVNNNLDSLNSFYNNTAYNARNTTNDLGNAWAMYVNADSYTIDASDNHIVHAPNLDTPVTVANVSTASNIGGVTLRHKGVKYKEAPHDSTSRTVANGASFNISYPAGTDQAYWQALSESRHMVQSDGANEVFYAELSEMSVTFGASNITIQNDSGTTWSGTCRVVLDRSSTYSAISSTYAPASTSIPQLTPTGSPAQDGATSGLTAYDSFNNPTTSRGSLPDQGAIQS